MVQSIVHMDLDTFFVSCERRREPLLNNIPLIIGGGSRSVVSCASVEARKYGVRSGMPQFMALKLCPNAKVLKGDFELYSSCSKEVTQIIQEQAPLMEKSSIDEFYLDITGMDKYFGCYKWTRELSEKIYTESALPISFGLSINKTVSKMATNEGKPFGQMRVEQSEVKSFLDPLSIKRIPGIGSSTFETLSRIGIRKVGTLSEVPTDILGKLLGKNGIILSQKSRGVDHTPVKPYEDRKSISKQRTFSEDTIDKHFLHTLLSSMVEDLCFQLRSENWLVSSISVKIKYTNFDTETKQVRLPYTASDHVIRQKALTLLDSLYKRRMRLRLIGVTFSKLVRGKYQINLFEDTPEKIRLYQAMDHLKSRFDAGAVKWASGYMPTKKNKQDKEDEPINPKLLSTAKISSSDMAEKFFSVGGDSIKLRGKKR